jgi:signal transduction histidine kinase
MLARIRSLLRLKQSYNEQSHLVSQIKSAYEQLTRTQAELVKAETNKAHMEGMLHTAGAICHEISQPLTSALITLQIIRQDVTNPETGNEIEEVENSLLHARDILDKLRALTRYETKSYLGEERILDLDRSTIPQNPDLYDKDVFSMRFEDLIGDD